MNNNQKGGAYDYWETGAAGEGYERGVGLGGSPPFKHLASGRICSLLATSNSREGPPWITRGLFPFSPMTLAYGLDVSSQ